MAKRKCGTCRYFRDAGIACSGWCTHPERGELHDLVLVRRAELACRNSWDQDLWQLRKPGTGKEFAAIPDPEVPRTLEPSPLQQQAGVLPDNPTDRVTSITISQIRRSREQFTPPPVTGGQPTESAVAQQRERTSEDSSTAEARAGGVSSLEPGFKRAVRASGTHRTRSADHPAPTYSYKDHSHATTDARNGDAPLQRALPAPVRSQALPGPELANDTSPLPVSEVNRLFAQRSELAQSGSQRVTSPPQTPTVTEQRDGVTRVHIDGIEFTSVTSHETFTPAVDAIDAAKPLRPAPIDEKKWVAGIPRCCDTCREFQRNPDGRTGVCGNSYAFSRRTVVECDQLACRFSGSVWWLPSDDFWLDRAEIAHHTRPTPYLDAVLSELRSGSR